MKNLDSKSLIQRLEFYFDHGKNVLLSGEKGIGKTSIITEVFNKKAKKWLYFSGSTLDPWVDFIGVPKEKTVNGVTTLDFIKPSYMSDDIEAIFIDEYNRSAKKVKNATMELIQFKRLNGQVFPNLKVVWVGINPYDPDADVEDIYDVEPLDPAQKDRFQIQINLPYCLDFDYFAGKYSKDWAEGALSWWNNLPDKIKKMVSPRRLDYALEIHSIKGNILDVLPIESNPSKLTVELKIGGVEKVLKQLLKNGKKEEAIDFLKFENNFQASIEIIMDNDKYKNFFFPLLDEERQISIFFKFPKFQDAVLSNPLGYKDFLESISHSKLCQQDMLRKINASLQRLKGVGLENFTNMGNNSVVTVSGILPNNIGDIWNSNLISKWSYNDK